MSQAAYSDLKPLWHIEKIQSLRDGKRIVPSQVQLIISDLCNQDCSFCSYRMSNGFSSEQFVQRLPGGKINRNPNRMIPYEKAIEILGDCAEAGVKAIQFTGGGEPTAHPRHLDIFKRALDLGMEAGLVTNGLVLRESWKDVLPRFSWIRVSLDAGDRESYASIRRAKASDFAKVLGNIKEIAATCPKALVGVGYTVTPENYNGISAGIASAFWSGASYVRISAMFSTEGISPFTEIYPIIKDQIARAKNKWENESFKVVDLFGDRIHDLEQHAPDYEFCGYQQFNVYVGGNLKVYRCCTTAYTLHGEVGDLSKTRFLDWLRTSDAEYTGFNARSCRTCQFNGKNRAINYAVGREPLHVHFV